MTNIATTLIHYQQSEAQGVETKGSVLCLPKNTIIATHKSKLLKSVPIDPQESEKRLPVNPERVNKSIPLHDLDQKS